MFAFGSSERSTREATISHFDFHRSPSSPRRSISRDFTRDRSVAPADLVRLAEVVDGAGEGHFSPDRGRHVRQRLSESRHWLLLLLFRLLLSIF